jgi:hypothetical protein
MKMKIINTQLIAENLDLIKEGVGKYTFDELSKVLGNKNQGLVYVISDFQDNVKNGEEPQKAFEEACENQNYCGSRSDVIKDREIALNIINRLFDYDIKNFDKEQLKESIVKEKKLRAIIRKIISEERKVVKKNLLSEKWSGGGSVKKLDKWGKAEMPLSKLKKHQAVLRNKEHRSPAESKRLKQINFAIRARTGWGKA